MLFQNCVLMAIIAIDTVCNVDIFETFLCYFLGTSINMGFSHKIRTSTLLKSATKIMVFSLPVFPRNHAGVFGSTPPPAVEGGTASPAGLAAFSPPQLRRLEGCDPGTGRLLQPHTIQTEHTRKKTWTRRGKLVRFGFFFFRRRCELFISPKLFCV